MKERWFHEVPQTDDECLDALERDNPAVTSLLRDLFRLYRKMGNDTLTSYEKTLLAHLEACNKEPSNA